MKSAKSPIESRSTLASRACGAPGRSLEPVEGGAVGLDTEFEVFGSDGGFERNPVCLVIDPECERLVVLTEPECERPPVAVEPERERLVGGLGTSCGLF